MTTIDQQSYFVAGRKGRMIAFGLILVLGLNARRTWSTVPAVDCPHEGIWLQTSQKCLMVLKTTEKKGFESVYESRKQCWSIGGEIASIDPEGAEAAATLFNTTLQSLIWRRAYTGLNDIEAEGNWTWFDGARFDPQMTKHWDSGEPNSGGRSDLDEDCVVMKAKNHRLQWHDYPCCQESGILAVFCQMTAKQLLTAALATNGIKEERFPDYNDPLALRCISEVNECLGVSCMNGGSCIDKLGRYECLCLDGFTGSHCESDINECLDAGCLNNSTCHDLTASYRCDCQPGFVGIHCETATCPEPPAVENSSRETVNFTEGSIVRYICKYGYRFPVEIGEQPYVELLCSGHTWNFANKSDGHYRQPQELPHCQPVVCSIFPTWYGIETEIDDLYFGTVITYRCNDGKQFSEEEFSGEAMNMTTTCQPNGSWIPDFKTCKYSETGKTEKIEPIEAYGAAAIGTVAIIFISIELALVVLMDFDHLVRHAKMFKDNVTVGFNRAAYVSQP